MTADNPLDAPDRPAPRLYGRRRGKRLRKGRQDLIETVLPCLRLPPDNGTGVPLDPFGLFPRPVREVWLEIGFGSGEHLAELAARHPDVGFIGCEAFVSGVAALVARIHDEGLANVRIFDDDARPLLQRIAAGSLSRAFLLFPDPWPKRRHAPRRFIQTATLDQLARILRAGGEFRVASDDTTYVRWALEQVTNDLRFAWQARRAADWREPPADWVPTRYEAKAKRHGRVCVYLSFLRRSEPRRLPD